MNYPTRQRICGHWPLYLEEEGYPVWVVPGECCDMQVGGPHQLLHHTQSSFLGAGFTVVTSGRAFLGRCQLGNEGGHLSGQFIESIDHGFVRLFYLGYLLGELR